MNICQYRQQLQEAAKAAQKPKMVAIPTQSPDISFHRMRLDSAIRHTKLLRHIKSLPVRKQDQIGTMLRADLQTAREWVSEAAAWAAKRGGEAGSNLILSLRENDSLVDAMTEELDAATLENAGVLADRWQGVFLSLKSGLERTRLLTYRPLPRKH